MKGFLVLFFILPLLLQAEPWLANRFVQNCASCHSPGRYNRPFKERGCTVSCQGCHVNPNGGGLRSFYGKWNSQKWLRSHSNPLIKDKGAPLPWFAQNYVKKEQQELVVAKLTGQDLKKDHQKISDFLMPKDPKQRKITAVAIEKFKNLKESLPHREVAFQDQRPKLIFPEVYYGRNSGDISESIELRKTDYENQIPYDDPYFQSRKNPVLVGADFRYQLQSPMERKPSGSLATHVWPMALDVGLQYRPLPGDEKWGRVSLVSETRHFNGPQNQDIEALFTSSSRVRSAYIMVDRLPYNGYVMHGIYKPYFEHYTPDHTSLNQRLLYSDLGGGETATFRSTSVGFAPNVQFINLHYVQPMLNSSYSQENGIILNTGLRFVRYGASLVYSAMSTTNKVTQRKTLGHSLQGGLNFKNWTGNAEVLALERKEVFQKNRGTIITLENRFQLFKQNYLEAIYESANTTTDLQAGSSNRYYLGAQFFVVAGVQVSLGIARFEEKPSGATQFQYDDLLSQIHLFY